MTNLVPSPLLAHEVRLWNLGYRYVAGVDEAGRGPLAGPVVAAAVILPRDVRLPEVDDSKKLSPEKREKLFDEIHKVAIAVGIGVQDNHQIDRADILRASLEAMRIAVTDLDPSPEFVLIDGIHAPNLTVDCLPIKKGDQLSLSIAAASIVAKVVRDRMMIKFDSVYPGYGFAQHKGYPTPKHYQALAELGPCPIHRRTFKLARE